MSAHVYSVPPMTATYELKLSTGRVVTWDGSSEIDAAERYVDCHRDAAVIATRPVRHGLFIGSPGEVMQ